VILNKHNAETMLIKISISGDHRAKEKELDEIGKYQELALELTGLWKTLTKVTPPPL